MGPSWSGVEVSRCAEASAGLVTASGCTGGRVDGVLRQCYIPLGS